MPPTSASKGVLVSRASSRRARIATLAALGVVSGLVPLAVTASPAQAAGPVTINLLATNDFHGRIKSNNAEAGAAVLAGAVKQLRAENPNTVFAAAGDLIGASTFESFVAQDKPTIDALNEAGLEVSAAGNHEFDQGYDDLINRVMAPESPSNPLGGATWKYIAANVKMKASGNPALDPTWVKTFNMGTADEVKVGFVGAVTEHLPELVSPGGIADIEVTDIVAAVNTEADKLKTEGVDLVVMLVHEGAPSTNCETMDDNPASDFGSIITGANDNVDAIVSGHTHLAYDCSFPVAGWAGRAVTERPVVSAGQYGSKLNQIQFTVDPATNAVAAVETDILSLASCNATCAANPVVWTPNYPVDDATKAIVDAAVAESDVLGAVKIGEIAGAFRRAARPKADDPTSTEENRGGESTAGNLVAEAQRWATSGEESGAAQIAFMNPGGLRADLLGTGTEAFPRDLSYKQAAVVQPFANTLVNMRLTGAQISTVLEQQWQPEGSSRPFLRLGTSDGFTYTYDPTAAAGSRIIAMYLNGVPLVLTKSYSVTVNSFLSTGGDNFAELANGTAKRDTGKIDLSAMVDYLAEFADDEPLAVDYSQHAVGVTFPQDAPAAYKPGDTVSFLVSSLAMSGAGDVQDTTLSVKLGKTQLGTATVDNTVAPGTTDDESGTALVSVTLPDSAPGGAQKLTLVGNATGTSIKVPITVESVALTPSKVTIKVNPKKIVAGKTRARIGIFVTADGDKASGKVLVRVAGEVYQATLKNGRALVKLAIFGRPGSKVATVAYSGSTTSSPQSIRVRFEVAPRQRRQPPALPDT
ncbi:MAG: bifunctional UDP-sugar hydrolase/5'-nucleotidase, partial [Nocardioides sp.]